MITRTPLLLVGLGCLVLTTACRAASAVEEPLTKRVGSVTSADGKPIAGATIRLTDADPSVHEDEYCPAVYPSIGKTFTTDVEGKYELTELYPRLKYEVAISAPGFKPHVIGEMSAWVTKPLLNKLQPETPGMDATDLVTGHVLNGEGKPIAGAVVQFFGEITGTGNGRVEQFGGLKGVDAYAVTGADGAFRCEAKGGHRKFFTKVRASGLAPQVVQMEAGSDTPDGNDVRLSPGCSVSGRLLKGDQPLAGVKIVLAQQNLAAEQCFGFFSAGTDADGKFTFAHLPEGYDYQLKAAVNSLGSRGATEDKKFKTPATTGAAVDVGDLTVVPAVTISGQLTCPEGTELPKSMSIWASSGNYDAAWARVDEQGSFKLPGLLPGKYSVSLQGGGKLRFAPENASYYPPMNALAGSIEKDTALKLKLAPAEGESNHHHNPDFEAYEAKKSEPLQGLPDKEAK